MFIFKTEIKSQAESRRHKVIIFLLGFALLFLILALTLDVWWVRHNNPRTTYGVFERVLCQNGVCTLSDNQESGFVLYVRLMIIMCSCFIPASMLTHVVFTFVLKTKIALLFISGGTSAVAGSLLFLTGMVMTGYFHKISNAFWRARFTPFPNGTEPLWYRTLPLFFVLMASLLCIASAMFTFIKLEKPKAVDLTQFSFRQKSSTQ